MLARWRLRLFWAALLAITTAWGVKVYLGSLVQTEPIVVAAKAIPARSQITADMLEVVAVGKRDRQHLAADAFRSIAAVVGQYARRRIEAGEVLRDRPSDFARPGAVKPGSIPSVGALADFLPPGTRAVSLRVDQQAVLGSHVQPGVRVDLVFTSKSDSTGGIYSSLLLQQVLVLDIQRAPADEPDKDVLVTVMVTVDQAVDLNLAKRTGVVDLVLNPPDPGEPVAQRVTSPLKFSGQPDTGPVKASPEPAKTEPPKPNR